MKRKTTVSIQGAAFYINDQPTYAGTRYKGWQIQGLLMNSRMVQGIFDDLNPQTRSRWNYPDGPWDPERNTNEFIKAMPAWREAGLLSFDINLQGGNPTGYGPNQPWHNSAFTADGSLRADYMTRLERILDRADELGMAPMVGYFYFGQDHRFADDAAVMRGADNATDWILSKGYTNVLIEVANEIDNGKYVHDIIKTRRGHELMERVKARSAGKVNSPAGRLLVSNSLCGDIVPPDNVIAASDYVLLHGNAVGEPRRIQEMVDQVRASQPYKGQPVVFNEDDHFDFDKDQNNMLAAISRYASWGYFDFRMEGEGFADGYQSVPVNWGISSTRKRGFFDLLRKVTGSGA